MPRLVTPVTLDSLLSLSPSSSSFFLLLIFQTNRAKSTTSTEPNERFPLAGDIVVLKSVRVSSRLAKPKKNEERCWQCRLEILRHCTRRLDPLRLLARPFAIR